ncbi:MAG: efflux RND transporter periplasmic adaptor subunit [Chromatiales bacterium]|nr:efflux RND transporter periplasmic adaptor subunit [Chromatiales bacterium]
MKIRTTLGVFLLLVGLSTADPVQRLWSAPATPVDKHRATDSEHGHDDHTDADHEKHGEDGHTEHDHAKDDRDQSKHAEDAHAGHDHPEGEHDHADDDHDHAKDAEGEHDHTEHSGDDHSGHDHTKGDDDHAEHADDEHAGHDHAEGDHDRAKHSEDNHSGHDHAEGDDGHAEHADSQHGAAAGAGDDDHAGHDHDEEGPIRLTPAVMQEFGIEVRVASGGSIGRTVRLPGEVVYNTDRIAHVSPMVAGRVQQVYVSVGDRVVAGQIMAVLASRELAAARSEYLAAVAKLELARENLGREKRLLSDKVGTTRAAAAARQAYREADIERTQAVNALFALGYSREQVTQTAAIEDKDFSIYELRAPLSGIVTQRHITIGEVVGLETADAPFVVADLSSVWVNLTVYQRDLAQVRAGMPVTIQFSSGIPDAPGTVAFVSPALDETTRTATARVVLENPHADWRPGLFVSGLIETGRETATIVVPHSALTELDGETVVFVQTDGGFESRKVRQGRATPAAVEIIDGLAEGERYAANNVLALKAETNRAALEHAGHVH